MTFKYKKHSFKSPQSLLFKWLNQNQAKRHEITHRNLLHGIPQDPQCTADQVFFPALTTSSTNRQKKSPSIRCWQTLKRSSCCATVFCMDSIHNSLRGKSLPRGLNVVGGSGTCIVVTSKKDPCLLCSYRTSELEAASALEVSFSYEAAVFLFLFLSLFSLCCSSSSQLFHCEFVVL
jgi:hypothetical protein